MPSKKSFLVAGGIVIVGIGAILLTVAGAPGSRAYSPASDMEASFMARASRTVFPQQVLDPADEQLVVWAGIVRGVDAEDTDTGRPIVDLQVEHRYFDWIEDRSIQPERYFLSPKGEGHFRTRWLMPPKAPASWVMETVHQKDMVVVYGYPGIDEQGNVEMRRTEYIRLIPTELWRDDVLSYGRGPEVESLKTPMMEPQPLSEK